MDRFWVHDPWGRCVNRSPLTNRRCRLPWWHQAWPNSAVAHATWNIMGRRAEEWQEPGVVYASPLHTSIPKDERVGERFGG